jgi:hypothetical protein
MGFKFAALSIFRKGYRIPRDKGAAVEGCPPQVGDSAERCR